MSALQQTQDAAQRAPRGLDNRIGSRIRARRLDIGMSQERLAALLGVSFQQIQKYEKGQNRVAASRLADIAQCLVCDVRDFFDQGGCAAASEGALAKATASPECHELLMRFSAIENVKVRRRVLALVCAIADDAA